MPVFGRNLNDSGSYLIYAATAHNTRLEMKRGTSIGDVFVLGICACVKKDLNWLLSISTFYMFRDQVA